MKRSAIALTLVSAMAFNLSHATDTSFYGSIRSHYTLSKSGDGDRISNMKDSGSRFGLKGSEDLGNGIKLIFELEWGFDDMEGGNFGQEIYNRRAHIGLQGDWGTIQIGRMINPFKDTVATDSASDQPNGLGRFSTMGALNYALWGSWDSTGNNRRSDMLLYLSPNFKGFTFNAGVIMDDDIEHYQNKKHIDLWTINGEYKHSSGLYGKLGYIQGYTRGASELNSDDNRKSSAWGGQFGYTSDPLHVVFSYTDAKMKTRDFWESNQNKVIQTKDNAKGWDIGGRYSFGDNYDHNLYLSYGQFEPKNHVKTVKESKIKDTHTKQRAQTITVGYQYDLSKRTRVWFEYEKVKYRHKINETTLASSRNDETKWKNDTISIGIRHDF